MILQRGAVDWFRSRFNTDQWLHPKKRPVGESDVPTRPHRKARRRQR